MGQSAHPKASRGIYASLKKAATAHNKQNCRLLCQADMANTRVWQLSGVRAEAAEQGAQRAYVKCLTIRLLKSSPPRF